MFDISKANRNIELFIFDIFMAIQKIKKVSSQLESFIVDDNYLDFIVKALEKLK